LGSHQKALLIKSAAYILPFSETRAFTRLCKLTKPDCLNSEPPAQPNRQPEFRMRTERRLEKILVLNRIKQLSQANSCFSQLRMNPGTSGEHTRYGFRYRFADLCSDCLGMSAGSREAETRLFSKPAINYASAGIVVEGCLERKTVSMPCLPKKS
jgi:hypothetical protein